jgi:hypothetical protein
MRQLPWPAVLPAACTTTSPPLREIGRLLQVAQGHAAENTTGLARTGDGLARRDTRPDDCGTP